MTVRRAADGSRNGLDLSVPWTYRVAQNPRFIWIPISLLSYVVGYSHLLQLDGGLNRESSTFFSMAVMFFSLGFVFLTVGGFSHFRAVTIPAGPVKSIPSHGHWLFYIPLLVSLLALSQIGLNVLLEPSILNMTQEARLVMLISGLVCSIMSFILIVRRAYHRQLVFTPNSLEYSFGTFRASIPWTSIVAMRPAGNVHQRSGGRPWMDTPSSRNFSAGMQLVVREGVESQGRRKKQRINGREVIGIDCSGYKVDPNTLMNAIQLLWSNPELRAGLDTPAGTQLFTGPSWNTRRRMRVGDRWDRATDEIIRATDGAAP